MGSSLQDDLEYLGIRYDAGASSYNDNIKKVINSRAEIFYGHELQIYEFIRSNPELEIKLKVLPIILKKKSYFVAFSKKIEKEKLNILTNELYKLQQSGFLKKIYKKYEKALLRIYASNQIENITN